MSGHNARQFVEEGRLTGATPDGRKKGEEFSKNLSPTMGADTEGVTALILTLGALDSRDFPGDFPPVVLEVEKKNGFADDPFYKNGILFRGTKGDLWFTHHGGYRFMPRSNGWCIPRVDRPNDFNYRRVTPAHFKEFYAAIRERREANDCFEYSVPLAKTVCLGNISALAGKGTTLEWDGHHVTNDAKADKWVTKEYRNGWNPFV